MKLKHKLYKKIADYFYSKLPVPNENNVDEAEVEDNSPPDEILLAILESIKATNVSLLHWSGLSEPSQYIKHIDNKFSISFDKPKNSWTIRVALSDKTVYTTEVPVNKSNTAAFNQILEEISNKATQDVLSLLKAGVVPENTQTE